MSGWPALEAEVVGLLTVVLLAAAGGRWVARALHQPDVIVYPSLDSRARRDTADDRLRTDFPRHDIELPDRRRGGDHPRLADSTPSGMTCSSVCSVATDPPTLLVCIRRESPTLQAMRSDGRFAVILLSRNSRLTAEIFASGSGNRFDRTSRSRWRRPRHCSARSADFRKNWWTRLPPTMATCGICTGRRGPRPMHAMQ
jgi:Flavin reductase like domain